MSDDLDAVENLLLLCGEHHAIVDNNPRIYSVEVLAKFKADHEARKAKPDARPRRPVLEAEPADLSLLPVSSLPGTVWRARTPHRLGRDVASELAQGEGRSTLPFTVHNRHLWAFHDLSDADGPFNCVVDGSTAASLEASSLLASADRGIYVRLLNSTLRDVLLRRGVRLDKEHDRFYFLPDPEQVTRRVEAKTKTGRHQSAKKVVRQEGERSGNLRDVWWHLAAQLRFEEFATGVWGLTVRPEFHLTTDGRTSLEARRIGPKITKRKSRMYNEGYFDAVHFIRYFLLDGSARLVVDVGDQQIVIEGDFPSVRATWPLINDKRFDPVRLLDSGDEDDVLDAVVESLADEEWDWGAEHSEDDR